MSLKPTHRSDTKEQQGHNYADAVTGGVSDIEEGSRQDEVAVKGGNHNDVQEDAWRDLGTVKEDDGNMGRGLQLTTAVSQQFGDASILKVESQAPLELEYRIMDSTPDQAVGDETVGGELTLDRKCFSTKNPRGACAKILEEEVGQDFGPISSYDDEDALDKATVFTLQTNDRISLNTHLMLRAVHNLVAAREMEEIVGEKLLNRILYKRHLKSEENAQVDACNEEEDKSDIPKTIKTSIEESKEAKDGFDAKAFFEEIGVLQCNIVPATSSEQVTRISAYPDPGNCRRYPHHPSSYQLDMTPFED